MVHGNDHLSIKTSSRRSSLLVVDEHQAENAKASKEDGEAKQDPHNWANETQVIPIQVIQKTLDCSGTASRHCNLHQVPKSA